MEIDKKAWLHYVLLLFPISDTSFVKRICLITESLRIQLSRLYYDLRNLDLCWFMYQNLRLDLSQINSHYVY